MSTTLRDAFVNIETAFSSSYLATTHVQYQNEPTVDVPDNAAWISFEIDIPEAEAITIDGLNTLSGLVDVNIYCPKNDGVYADLVDVADSVRTILNNLEVTNVYFEAASGLTSLPDMGEYYGANISTPFTIIE